MMMKDESHIGTIETRKVLVAVVRGRGGKKERNVFGFGQVSR